MEEKNIHLTKGELITMICAATKEFEDKLANGVMKLEKALDKAITAAKEARKQNEELETLKAELEKLKALTVGPKSFGFNRTIPKQEETKGLESFNLNQTKYQEMAENIHKWGNKHEI